MIRGESVDMRKNHKFQDFFTDPVQLGDDDLHLTLLTNELVCSRIENCNLSLRLSV